MLTCKQATKAIASDELDMASWRRRAVVRLHLLRCGPCRRYAAQLRAIGSATWNLYTPRDDDDATLKRLEKALEADIQKT